MPTCLLSCPRGPIACRATVYTCLALRSARAPPRARVRRVVLPRLGASYRTNGVTRTDGRRTEGKGEGREGEGTISRLDRRGKGEGRGGDRDGSRNDELDVDGARALVDEPIAASRRRGRCTSTEGSPPAAAPIRRVSGAPRSRAARGRAAASNRGRRAHATKGRARAPSASRSPSRRRGRRARAPTGRRGGRRASSTSRAARACAAGSRAAASS